MSEVRQALPTISQIKYTTQPIKRYGSTGYMTQDGKELLRVEGVDYPGIVTVITPYVNNIAMPLEVYEFTKRAFLEEGLAELLAIETPDDNVVKTIQRVQSQLSDPLSMWLEDIEAITGSVKDLFSQAYSDALDEFPQLKEPTAEEEISGIPYYQGLLQWDARLPWNDEQSILMKTGFFAKQDLTGPRTVEEVKFESGKIKRMREATLQRHSENILRLNGEIAEMESIVSLLESEQTEEVATELATKNQELVNNPNLNSLLAEKKAERDGIVHLKTAMESVTYGSLPTFLQKPSVATASMAIASAVFLVLKEKLPQWANLDLELVLSRYALPDVS